MANSMQAKLDGTLEDGPDPPHPTKNDQEQFLKNALNSNGYLLHSIVQTTYSPSQFVKFTSEIEKGDNKLKLEIFYFANLAWSSGNRSVAEKRIQITQDWDLHSDEFNLGKKDKNRCMLIGTYTRNGQTIFCAWDAYSYREHAKPTSCYVSIEAIAFAMRDGFGQSDSKGRLVCCFRPEFIHYYINNMEELHQRVNVSSLSLEFPTPEAETSNLQGAYISSPPNTLKFKLPRNRILFGAPGTGKSHKLNQEAVLNFPDPSLITRVTFYPDYSYSHLIGSYRPTPIYRESQEKLYESDKITQISDSKLPVIDYKFIAGPMLQMYSLAVKHASHNFLLIIEELNRTDAAAAFGDWFQLLDRNTNGESEFVITPSNDVVAFLASQFIPTNGIKLPSNLYIWATMNSADQGVLPLDAAFKRRWSFEYVGLEDAAAAVAGESLVLPFVDGGLVNWNLFRGLINNKLRELGISEDRLLGPFFLKREEMQDSNLFKNKLLMYLREDVVRHDPLQLFKAATFGEIVRLYDDGINVFNDINFE